MSMNDPIADLLTRIRNAGMVSKPWTDIPCSKQKIRILYILKEEHFIRDYVKIKSHDYYMNKKIKTYQVENTTNILVEILQGILLKDGLKI